MAFKNAAYARRNTMRSLGYVLHTQKGTTKIRWRQLTSRQPQGQRLPRSPLARPLRSLFSACKTVGVHCFKNASLVLPSGVPLSTFGNVELNRGCKAAVFLLSFYRLFACGLPQKLSSNYFSTGHRPQDKYTYTKKRTTTIMWLFFFEIRQLPILPSGVPLSTFGNVELNFCVRNGNRWILYFIITGMVI